MEYGGRILLAEEDTQARFLGGFHIFRRLIRFAIFFAYLTILPKNHAESLQDHQASSFATVRTLCI